MTFYRYIFLLLFFHFLGLSCPLSAQQKAPVKIACVGNSITYGAGIKDRLKDSYPAQLQRMLGEEYEVRNFGVSGRTLLQKGDYPYMKETAFQEALKFQPHIVVVKLGTNDTKPQNWKHKADFKGDYKTLINKFANLPSHPEIYLCKPVPAFPERWGIRDSIIRQEVLPLTEEIARETGVHLIDLYSALEGKSILFPDKIHPNAKGAGVMARTIHKALTGKEGKLLLQEWPGMKTQWKGFERYNFNLQGHGARVVCPQKALPGNPWVWRARFPDWHTEMDSILLAEGFHVAFVNTDNQYGSPKAMKVWDAFYNYLTGVHDLNGKVALEGVSRGGLFVYGWAKRHPHKVNCIYAEAPVCDFKSWPGGQGTGKGSPADWKRLLNEYGFASPKDAKKYANNPIENLDSLAAAKVPVLHMIGLKDGIVPPKENTLVLVDHYVKLGGVATIVPCTRGKQELMGHHFPIETPRMGADFIKYHTPLPKAKLNAADYHFMRGGLQNSRIKFEREKKGRVAFLGGSITYNPGWRDKVCQYLKERFPETEFEFIAAGIPSMGTTPGAYRFERDILCDGPVDLLFEEAAVNDRGNRPNAIEQIRGMEGIVRHARQSNPAMDIVIMHFVDPDKMTDYNSSIIPAEIQNHDKIANHYHIPTINLAKEVTDRINAGEFTWEDDFKNLHPSPFGQEIYFHSMKTFLDNAWYGYVAEDDKITNYMLPDKFDPHCYDNGNYISIEKASLKKGWTIVPNWKPTDKKGVRDGYVNVPMLVAETPGAELKLKFEGRAIGLTVAAGPDAGIIEYSIDGEPFKKQDLFTRWSMQLHLPWYYVLDAELKPGKHTMKLRISDEKNPQSKGNACRIKAFITNK